jgi:arabinan endo-1,5-alpha-L-arabinosidase
MREIIITLLILILSTSCLAACARQDSAPAYSGFRSIGDETTKLDPAQWGELNTHDPSIFKDGDTYYVFSTDASNGDVHKLGVQVRKSTDLVTWQYVGPAFQDYEKDCAEVIAYAKLDPAKKEGLWAPDVIKVGQTYRMYFSASTFGSSRSCIGLAEATKPEGPYTYKGIVIQSEVNAVSGPNAIDPALVYDDAGKLYMSYGSFSGGIFMTELNPATGLVQDRLAAPVRIAGSRGAAIEGSYIVQIPESGYYYLFVSYGSLASDYNIRVGRSRSVTGPYLDANGRDLASLGAGNEERVGTKLLGGYTFVTDPGITQSKGYMAPGHNSALIDGIQYYLVHHVRTYALPGYWFYMNVRSFYLNKFGWPVVAPNRYQGEKVGAIDLPAGEYGLVQHLADSNSQSHKSVKITLADEKISGSAAGSYKVYDGYRIELNLDGTLYDGVVLKQYDWERQADVISFTAMSETGLCVWGNTQLK